jgi:hypothetical protein
MADWRAISLPYGLSKFHRQNKTMGKVTVFPVGGCARWKIPPLERVSANTNIVPVIDIRREIERPHNRPRNCSSNQFGSSVEEDMIPTTTEVRKRKRAPALAERRHLSKPSRTNKAPTPDSEMETSSFARKRLLARGTRIGASKDAPVTIDDDNDTLEDEQENCVGRDLFRSSLEVFPPTPSFSGLYSPLIRTREVAPAKRRFGSIRGTYAAPPERVQVTTMGRAPSIDIGSVKRSVTS